MPSPKEIEAAAAAISNARAVRKGGPAVINILDILKQVESPELAEVMDDASAALEAAEAVRARL
jgi:hypothetical protein